MIIGRRRRLGFLWGKLVARLYRMLLAWPYRGAWRIRRFVLSHCPSRELVCTTQHGVYLIVNPAADPYQKGIFETGTYEPGLLALMSRLLRAGDVFVDVGANIGLMSLVASRLVGSTGYVYAFEPEPGIYNRLLDNIALNSATNIEPIPHALGSSHERRRVFSYPAVNIGRASLVESKGAILAGETSVITLDDFLLERSARVPRMVKIDVEGFEYEVLLGATRMLRLKNPPVLCVECDDEMPRAGSSAGMADIHDLVLSTGKYSAYRLEGTKFAPGSALVSIGNLEEVPRHDNVIYIPSHLSKG